MTMSENRGKLQIIDDDLVAFKCPGCGSMHVINTDATDRPAWGFNGNYDAPTFTPSILAWRDANPDAIDGFEEYRKPYRCHSFVTDGNIQFLGDCTHALAGQTVPLEPVLD